MNERQRTILLCVGGAIIAALLFPPYAIRNPGPGGASYVFESGFAFLLHMPPRATVDVTTLAVEWIAVAILGGIAWLLAKH